MKARLDRAAVTGLLRPRIAVLVLVTAAVGFALERPDSFEALPATLLGTLLTAAAGCALNHYLERDTDARMERTRRRPLVTGALSPAQVLLGGLVTAASGLAVLGFGASPATAGVQAAALFVYLAIYTPLKRRTSSNTWVGAIPGALPLITGAVAAGGPSPLSWAAFALIFLWQLPHFFAIASMYREEYAEGGLRMLSGVDPEDRLLRWQMPMQVMSVMLVSMIPVVRGEARGAYLAVAVLVGLLFLFAALGFRRRPDRQGARRVVVVSVLYLPLVLLALVLDVACSPRDDTELALGVREPAQRASELSSAENVGAAHDAAPAGALASAADPDLAPDAPLADEHTADEHSAVADADEEFDCCAPGNEEPLIPWADLPNDELNTWFIPDFDESGLPYYGRLPEFELTTEARQPFSRDDFAGRTWVVGFIYARCGAICADMTSAYQQLHEAGLPSHCLSITIDPANDTPEMLTAYRAEWKGSADWWTLLTGRRETIQHVADEGFRLPVNTLNTQVENMPKMFHSGRLALLDETGAVRGYYAVHDAAERLRLLADARALHALLP